MWREKKFKCLLFKVRPIVSLIPKKLTRDNGSFSFPDTVQGQVLENLQARNDHQFNSNSIQEKNLIIKIFS
jgi:hypothetical protein